MIWCDNIVLILPEEKISDYQRWLRCGYARAARLRTALREAGVYGEPISSGQFMRDSDGALRELPPRWPVLATREGLLACIRLLEDRDTGKE